MPPTAAPDASTFLESLDFDAETLKEAKATVHTNKTFRQALYAQTRAIGEGTTGQDALRKATALYLLSDPREALKFLGRDQTSPQGTLLRGLCSLEMGDPATGQAALASLVGTSVEGPNFYLSLATAAALVGDTAMAEKAAGKLSNGPDHLYAEGIALESDGEYAEAMKKYEAAIGKDPGHARALFRLALRYDISGEDERAIETYRRLVNLRPTHVNALQNLALLYEDHGRFADAENCYRRVLQFDGSHVRARIGLKDVVASQNMYYDEDHERREDRRAEVMRTPISEFELSVRSRNCLSKMNISSLGDLARKSEPELLAYKNFGETSLQEIKDILAQKGLRLGMQTEDDQPLYASSREQVSAQLDALFGPGPQHARDEDDDDDEEDEVDEPDLDDPAYMPIERLELSIRAKRCMEVLGIETIGALIQHSEAELLNSKNFGQTSLNEVRKKLTGLGFALRRK